MLVGETASALPNAIVGTPRECAEQILEIGSWGVNYLRFAFDTLERQTAFVNHVLPLVQANNAGIVTGVQIQNAGEAETTATLSFGSNVATPSKDPGAPRPCSGRPALPVPAGCFAWPKNGASSADMRRCTSGM